MMRTEKTTEGKTFYRMLNLTLTRQRALSLSRSWNVVHVINAESPLHGETPESLAAKEDATAGPGHRARRRDDADGARRPPLLRPPEILWGYRMADVLSETEDGHLLLNLRKFQDVEPTEATADFPYP